MSRLDPEVRAAEIVAAIVADFPKGGWFACMTQYEQSGWNIHESEWWYGKEHDFNAPVTTPRNDREWAGWLAREILYPFDHETPSYDGGPYALGGGRNAE
jgi:hypothetical protein